MRSQYLAKRKNTAMEHVQRANTNLQEQFFKTAQSNNDAQKPILYETYQKEFAMMKVPKPKVQDE